MARPTSNNQDDKYLRLLLDPLKASAKYRPKFGKGKEGGTTLEEFRAMYGADPLYHWVGLDSELMYAAHRAAGGMTSVYRQLGIGCERLFKTILIDTCKLTEAQASWEYTVKRKGRKPRRYFLDGRIDVAHLKDGTLTQRVSRWVKAAAKNLGVAVTRVASLRGAVFEVRQGYKSKDSKRQTADLAFGTRAYNEDYLPVVLVFSRQIDADVADRYTAQQMLVLKGVLAGASTDSTYSFCDDVLGYSLEGFFSRNTRRLREEFTGILERLLSAA